MASVIINLEQQKVLNLIKDILAAHTIDSRKKIFEILEKAAGCDYSKVPQPTLKQISFILCSVTDILRFLRQLAPQLASLQVRRVARFDQLHYSLKAISLEYIERDLFAALDNWILSTKNYYSIIDDSNAAADGFNQITNFIGSCAELHAHFLHNERFLGEGGQLWL